MENDLKNMNWGINAADFVLNVTYEILTFDDKVKVVIQELVIRL